MTQYDSLKQENLLLRYKLGENIDYPLCTINTLREILSFDKDTTSIRRRKAQSQLRKFTDEIGICKENFILNKVKFYDIGFQVIFYSFILWIAVTSGINAFKNKQLTQTELFLTIPKAFVLNFDHSKKLDTINPEVKSIEIMEHDGWVMVKDNIKDTTLFFKTEDISKYPKYSRFIYEYYRNKK